MNKKTAVCNHFYLCLDIKLAAHIFKAQDYQFMNDNETYTVEFEVINF